MKKKILEKALLLFFCFSIYSCQGDYPLNDPYDRKESLENIFYSSFSQRPKHLDPVRSYSSSEYAFIGQIYEPPFQYHYLKRPYKLIPLTAEKIPSPIYYDKNNNILDPEHVTKENFFSAVYEIKIKKGIKFQNHPAFAKDEEGKYLYHSLKEKDLTSIFELKDFKHARSRELVADDYIYQIKRMANPQFHCPIFPILATYIDGFSEYAKSLQTQLKKVREKRKEAGGVNYNQETDEQENPITLDLNAYPLKGVERVDKYTFKIQLKKKYPQFIYWMAMPFFSPMPWEAEIFYNQGVLLKRQISLDWYPVGTGPYKLAVNNPNKEMILLKNENFHEERYPEEGFDGAKKLGLLDDAGKVLPFIEKAVYKLEKEDIPYWNKFLQGYYDASGITSDSFDQSIRINKEGDVGLTDAMKEKGIKLSTSVRTTTMYMGFNMLDDVVGGITQEKKKLRQAISIAVNYEEYIQIFLNERGIPAHSPLPPGIFGFMEEKKGYNPKVYNLIDGKVVRKSITEAKQLLKEAGYPGGKSILTGKPLIIYFDTPASGPDAKSFSDWLRKQFKKIDIQLVIRSTDYNRFQEKMLKGNAQMYQWGWNADYPDPENFLFLLYGPNQKVKKNGENASNYANEKFDILFRQMENMENSPERLKIIKEMIRILQDDAPWLWGFHPISYGLFHQWFKNSYPNLMANNSLKYLRIDPKERLKKRKLWNKPIIWPILAGFFILFAAVTGYIISIKKKSI